MRVVGILAAGGRAWNAPLEAYRRMLVGESILRVGAKLLATASHAVGVVVPPELVAEARLFVGELGVEVAIVPAVRERWTSLRNALGALGRSDITVLHDVFRPLATADMFRQVLTEASGSGAAACAVHADALVAEIDDQHRVMRAHAADRVRLLQTPQGFVTGLLQDGLDAAAQSAGTPLDDVAAVGSAGGLVQLVPGEPLNRQLLTPEDFSWAEAVMQARRTTP
jgi:2-C-methyl-D-erythritol 4-phosphate cytidylyltransferase